MKLSIGKNRIEAFSDGVIAIIITIMVLELPYPANNSYQEIMNFLQSLFVFFDSFFIVGSFWYKHCLLFQEMEEISSKLVWRNLVFLFIMSLFPLFTKWVIADFGQVLPAIAYILLYVILGRCYMLLFFSEISHQSDKEFKKLNRIRDIIFCILIMLAVIMTYYLPYVASVLFIGIPLINALSNVLIEKKHPRERRNAIRRN